MNIKSTIQLVSEALDEIKTIDADQAYKMVQDNNCNLIDIRESNELESTGKVEGAIHIPRGMLEIYLDPNSPVFQNGQMDQKKEFVLFCAGGVRSTRRRSLPPSAGLQPNLAGLQPGPAVAVIRARTTSRMHKTVTWLHRLILRDQYEDLTKAKAAPAESTNREKM